jgi:hypothetical protein
LDIDPFDFGALGKFRNVFGHFLNFVCQKAL